VFHLSDPAHGILAIKFIHVNFGKIKFMMRGGGMKGHGLGGVSAFGV
jgi:hypothetical protein